VVASAIITIIENRTGERMPRSSPMLSTTSSTRPRVLSNTPISDATVHDVPITRAATADPTPFPITATPRISPA
jgi:hypothetical protein